MAIEATSKAETEADARASTGADATDADATGAADREAGTGLLQDTSGQLKVQQARQSSVGVEVTMEKLQELVRQGKGEMSVQEALMRTAKYKEEDKLEDKQEALLATIRRLGVQEAAKGLGGGAGGEGKVKAKNCGKP